MQHTQRSFPKLSIRERDRRYALIRKGLQDLQVDCAILTGTNLFYVTNGLPGERYGLLPTEDKPPTVVINFRNLADITVQVFLDMQEWIQDIRGGLDASHLIETIKELHLETGTLGIAGLGYGGINQGFYAQAQKAFPSAKLVDVSDVLNNVRTIKSDEEISMIDAANRIFDAAVKRVCEIARPGMLGRRVLEEGIRAMWEAGGDLHSSFNFHFGAVPKQNPVLMQLCLDQVIKKGDIGTLTAHAEYKHYAGHSDHQISFGEPNALHRDLFSAVLRVRDAVLRTVRQGVTHLDLVETYQKACRETDFRPSPHSQTHQYGIDVPEFPGPAFKVADTSKDQLSGRLGLGFRGGNFELRAGMIYSISPTLLAKEGEDTMLAGTTLVVTESGYRELGDRKLELSLCA
ncbi:MAG TPA: M24 family metallopeptidase [Candidatus Binatia bacterium]|nr:M24 family metallopeptidase [Candidatus Binatia bacterium]